MTSARTLNVSGLHDVQRGRELAAEAIEAEAKAYEAQFGTDGRGGDAAAVLWMAAKIARGEG
jgi:hypothetical protein